MPQLGAEHATQACAVAGIRTGDLLFYGMTPNHLSHTSQGGTIDVFIIINSSMGGNVYYGCFQR